jgi:uncharacterized protein YceK
MKTFIIFMMLCTLSGCAQQRNVQPGVSGPLRPINSPAIMQELGHE